MPRDSNGNYTLPPTNPVAADTVIEIDWANPTLGDIGNELKNSLDRSGRGTMLGPLLIADGVAGAPGLAFGQDSSSGLYRDASTGAWLLTLGGQNMIELYLDTTVPAAPVPSINFHAATSFGDTSTTFDDGTRLQPGIRFTAEQQSGLYRAGADDVGVSVGQTDMWRARKADGVLFPYGGEGSSLSIQRNGSGRIGREAMTASGVLALLNGARINAVGDNFIAEQAQVLTAGLSLTQFNVNAYDGQVIGNSLASPVQVLRADASGVYSSSGKLATAAELTTSYLPLTGGAMTGPIAQPADPTLDTELANKRYVDNKLAAGYLPLTGGVLTGNLGISKSTPGITFDGLGGSTCFLQFLKAGVMRWQFGADFTSGNDNWFINRYNASGVYQQASLSINPNNGIVQAIDGLASPNITVLQSAGAGLVINPRTGTGSWTVYSNTSTHFGIFIGGVDRMTMDATGNATFTGNVSAYSDRKVKRNIVPISDALAKVRQLLGVAYDRTDIEQRQIGLVAQDVELVVPEVVMTNDNGKSIAYGNLTALLVEAVKDLDRRVTAMAQTP